ncbi:MAG: NAD(P)H-binding protein [Planctomycetaceae bacterium]|nr:NAD(P)H-binding protein [Planctomycetaceae bacterium]
MERRKILVQLDTDAQPSVFDSVVAVDSHVDQLFRHANITPENVVGLVHGAIFTRGSEELHYTALFLGGSDVVAAERVFEVVKKTFFGPMRVSVMFDPNGANTTAAAAVLAAGKHVPLAGATATVLAATGPVGQRAVRLLAREGATVRVASRTLDRAQAVVDAVRSRVPDAKLQAIATSDDDSTAASLDGASVVIAAGAAGKTLVTEPVLKAASALRVAIDLNAVPPAGIMGVGVMDKAKSLGSLTVYGAIGVGGTKMKIHKQAIRSLFEANNRLLDAEELYEIGRGV